MKKTTATARQFKRKSDTVSKVANKNKITEFNHKPQ